MKFANMSGGYAQAVPRTPRVCTACPLHENCTTNCISPRGADQPHLLLVGEAPGPDEDRQGLPFIGRSGKLLDEMLSTARINPATVRWTNSVRCFPKQADGSIGKPTPQEVKTCVDRFLLLEIAQQKPGLIVALGKTAATALTGKRSSLQQLRGYTHWFRFPDWFIEWAETQGMILYEPIPERTGGVPAQRYDAKTCESHSYPVVVTYHPSHALRKKSQSIRGIIESDLDYARRKVYREPRLPGVDYRVVQSVEELQQWSEFLVSGYRNGTIPFLSFDLETAGPTDEAGLQQFQPDTEIVTAQIAYAEKKAILIPVSHPEGNFANAFGVAAVREFLFHLFVRENIPAAGQNLNFDYKFLFAKFGIRIGTVAFDTQLAHQCLFAGDLPNDLDFLSSQYVGMQGYTDGLKEAMDSLPKGQKNFRNLPLNADFVDYGCGDVDAVFRLVPVLTEMLREKDLWQTYNHVYLDSFKPLAEMEINGLPIDLQVYEWLKFEMPTHLNRLLSPIRKSRFYPYYLTFVGCPPEHVAGVADGTAPPKIQRDFEFNPGSTKQKTKLLFDVMGLPQNPDRVSKATGEPSTDKAAIAELQELCVSQGWAEHREVVEAIQEYAIVSKLHSAYVLNLPKVVPNKDEPKHDLFSPYIPDTLQPWYWHPRYKLEGTQTGRASSSGPAIHNMPGKSAVKRMVRSRWRDRGGVHVQFDYGAMEVRVLACRMMANDPTLKEAFAQGFDAHKYVASIIFRKPVEEVTPKERKVCKTVNFAVLYGAGPANVAGVVGCSVQQAEKFIADYLGALPHVTQWKAAQERFALTNGYVRSAFGRIRYLSTRVYSRGDIERRAVNTPIQSTASDITLTSYNRVHRRMGEIGFRSLPYLFVHDSLGFDTFPGEFFDLWEFLQHEMAVVPPQIYPWLDVPLAVDCDAGYSWGAMCSVERQDRNHWKLVSPDSDRCGALVSQLELAGHRLGYSVREEFADGESVSAWYLQVDR